MALLHRFLIVSALVGLAACSAPQADTAPPTALAQATGPQTSAPSALPALDGRSYADARADLLAAGWSPLPSATCVRDVFGDVPADRCAAQATAPECTACTDTPELEACSGAGECLMRFTHAGERAQLHVTTAGDLADRHARVDGLVVQRHERVVPTP